MDCPTYTRGRAGGGGEWKRGCGSSKCVTVVYIKGFNSLGKLHTLITATIHAIGNYDFGKKLHTLIKATIQRRVY